MTSAASRFPGPPDLLAPGASLADLDERTKAARTSPSAGRDDPAEALEVAHHELSAAGEEARAQRGAIARLVESHRSLRLRHERTMAILPVAVVVTDEVGVIRSANEAAAALVKVDVARLQGRPIFELFAVDDRQALRRLVSDRSRGGPGDVRRRAATLDPRSGDDITVEVTASVQAHSGAPGEISWVLLASTGHEQGIRDPLAATVAALAELGRRRSAGSDALHQATSLCADVLGAAVTIGLGHPAAPTSLSSSRQLAQECDGAQLTAGEGPTITAYEKGVTAVADTGDAAGAGGEPAWPRLAGRLPPDGSTVVSVPLRTGEGVAGTFTAYRPVAAPPEVEAVELLAVTLGGVLHELELADELAVLEADMERALASRAVIDQAKGIVMAARGVDADAAWHHLVKLSNAHQMKLRDLAASMVAQVARRS